MQSEFCGAFSQRDFILEASERFRCVWLSWEYVEVEKGALLCIQLHPIGVFPQSRRSFNYSDLCKAAEIGAELFIYVFLFFWQTVDCSSSVLHLSQMTAAVIYQLSLRLFIDVS